MSEQEILEVLQKVEALEEVPEKQLEWLIQKSEIFSLKEGDFLFKKGMPVDHMYVVIKGMLTIKLEQGGNFRTIGEFEERSITGGLPYSRAKEAIGFGIAAEPSKILALHKDHFEELIKNHFDLARALVHFMTTRVREFTKQQQQNDKMAALGKLSAGLAHELNNPSAAVIRSAQSLKKHLNHLPEKFTKVLQIKMEEDQIKHLNDILFRHIASGTNCDLSIIERAELEDDLLDWLSANDVDNADEIAENLVDYGFSIEDLEDFNIPDANRSAVLNWMNQVMTTEKMVNEIEESARRINSLVMSIKSYTHMDQSPEKITADIHSGINNTITMLQHKIKKEGVKLEKEYGPEVPKSKIYVSELNQVWTNIIDNAVDAMKESEEKVLKISTKKQGDFIKVNISDTGSGISEEHQSKIFDPFFTTKKIGEGTGLGLDVVQQIIRQHNGSIRVDSKPGETNFEICIPIQ